MDYSVYHSLILEQYLPGIFWMVFIIIACLVGLIRLVIEYKRNKEKFDYVLVIGVSILVSIVFYMFGWGYLLDVPNAINRKYEIATGTAIDFDIGGDYADDRGFHLQRDDSGEIVNIVAFADPIHKGDRLSVIYLQHTGIGVIAKRLN